MPMRPLTRFAIVAEQPGSCGLRLHAAGMPADAANDVAFYLDQASNFLAYRDAVERAFAAYGVACRVFDPASDLGWLDWVRQDAAGSMIWNMTDGIAYYLGSAVPAAARLAGIATFGPPASVQALAQDKFAIAAVARALGIDTPPMALARGDTWLSAAPDFPGPYFVKPATLGAKIGIAPDARCDTLAQALERAGRIAHRFADDAIVQPFVAGHDVRVSYLAVAPDAALDRLGAYQLAVDDKAAFMTFEQSRRSAGDSLSVPALKRIEHPGIVEAVRRLTAALRLRDIFSFDFRLTAEGRPWLLECEVCPAVTIYDFRRYLADVWQCALPEALARATLQRWTARHTVAAIR